MDIGYFNLVKYSKGLNRYALETPSHTYNFENLEVNEIFLNKNMNEKINYLTNKYFARISPAQILSLPFLLMGQYPLTHHYL